MRYSSSVSAKCISVCVAHRISHFASTNGCKKILTCLYLRNIPKATAIVKKKSRCNSNCVSSHNLAVKTLAMEQDASYSFRRLRSLKAPGTFEVSLPLNDLKSFNNTKDPSTLKFSSEQEEQAGVMLEASRLNQDFTILRYPESAQQRRVILSHTPELLSLKESRVEKVQLSEESEEEEKEEEEEAGDLSSKLEGSKFKYRDDENDEEVFYEASPVMQIKPFLPASDSFNNFELQEYTNFKLDSSNIIQRKMDSEIYYPSLLRESFSPIVEVRFEPMGRPLISNSMPLNLEMLICDANQIMIRKSAPFCNIYDSNTFRLLHILEYEFDLLDAKEEGANEEVDCGWLTKFRRLVFGYSESEYSILYPWQYLSSFEESKGEVCRSWGDDINLDHDEGGEEMIRGEEEEEKEDEEESEVEEHEDDGDGRR
ncbi:hypothetical protein CLIB1423_05S04302 [[Candida] railenensis]|uniref:Uncharacterized protein n=1 Tax=[Candida] railenensis TaxID=45579 RepID=A0A9P0VX39_9ASCO|nr:hypothetical protein CLIB1423_05S04302 [[Candida] railenensis]